MNKVKIAEKFDQFNDQWSPKIVGELNGQHVKLVKIFGPFVWHKHENEDELFFVVKGQLTMEFRDRTEVVNENEFIIVPRGIEHRPVAEKEAYIMLFEPASTLNTGDTINEFTKEYLEEI